MRRSVVAGLVLAMAGCNAAASAYRTYPAALASGQPEVRALLLAELRRQVTTGRSELSDSTVGFHARASTVIPGLVYYWGVFSPARVTHVRYSVVAGVVRGHSARIIRSPTDWRTLTRDWAPHQPQDALGACIELLSLDPSISRPGREALFIVHDSLVDRASVPNRGLIRTRTTLPAVALTGADRWEVGVWAITAPDVVHFLCRVEGERAETSRGEIIRGAGFIPV